MASDAIANNRYTFKNKKYFRDLTIFNDFFEFTQIIVGLKLIIFNHKLLNKNIQILNLHSYNINTLLND